MSIVDWNGIFSYLGNLSPAEFARIFWFFLFLDFLRYVLIGIIIFFIFNISRPARIRKYKRGREMLFVELPLVSVIVPGKNEGLHIYKLVNSLSEQTYRNFEIIIIDDGSTDDTPAICTSLKNNGFIDLYLRNNERGGKASAANMALRFSKGKYILHLDADCSLDQDAIEKILIPFYTDPKIGGVGGNVKIRNQHEGLAASFQAVEYLKTISVGRFVAGKLGILRIISGAFGAFRKDLLLQIGGWDVGPGLDGDLSIKLRKMGYRLHQAHDAICLTSGPITFKALAKQRYRWDKSLIRFRLRKHSDMLLPQANFRWSSFIAIAENLFFNLFLDIVVWVYFADILINQKSVLTFVIWVNFLLYIVSNLIQFAIAMIFSERRTTEWLLLPYVFAMPIYTGVFIRIVRTYSYIKEFFFRSSYDDPWNPAKSSIQAKAHGL